VKAVQPWSEISGTSFDARVEAAEPRAPRARVTLPDDGPWWAAYPKYYWLNGEIVELYFVGALAAALGRCSASVRRLERDGVLPPAPFQIARGLDGTKRRCYARQHIERIVAIADDEGVLGRKVADYRRTAFTARVQEAYRELQTPAETRPLLRRRTRPSARVARRHC